MKRLLAATCAAAMLSASLTGCGMTDGKETQNNTAADRPSYNTSTGANNGTGNTGTNGSTGSVGGTSGTSTHSAIDGTGNDLTNNGVNGSTNTYADGSAQDRDGYNRMLSSRMRYGVTTDGKYDAYSDGHVSDKGSTGSLMQDTRNAGRNLVDGARNVVRDVTRDVRDMGGVPRADDMPAK